MFLVDAPFPPGTVIVLSTELARYSDFNISLIRMKAPAGSSLLWQKGVEIAYNLNQGIRAMLGEWVFILGDDHAFKPDVLLNLLDLNLDVVVPACSSRAYPFYPVLYPKYENGVFKQGPWDTIPPLQISPMAGAGSAGMLIRKKVLDAVGDPWFEAGRSHREMLSEDLWFCKKVNDAGYQIHVDSREMIGHITPATIWPGVIDGKMVPMANINGDEKRWVRLDVMMTTEPQPENPLPKVVD